MAIKLNEALLIQEVLESIPVKDGGYKNFYVNVLFII